MVFFFFLTNQYRDKHSVFIPFSCVSSTGIAFVRDAYILRIAPIERQNRFRGIDQNDSSDFNNPCTREMPRVDWILYILQYAFGRYSKTEGKIR